MKLSFLGACREVGRSCVLAESGKNSFLMDCGINLGEEHANGRFPRVSGKLARKLDAVVISHAHLDHSGYLPALVKKGFRGKIFCSKASRDLMHLLLSDAAKIGKEEGNAIFSGADVEKTMKLVHALEFEEEVKLNRNLRFKLLKAGHIPGSSMVLVQWKGKRLLYTGDFNTRETNLLDPAEFCRADFLIMESTYGGRGDQLPSFRKAGKDLADVIKGTFQQGGMVLVPVFAVGRGQEIMFSLENYIRSRYLPDLNVFVDGMVSRANRICRHNVIYLKEEIPNRILLADDDPFKSPHLKVPQTKSKSDVFKASNVVVLATSGMLTGGPVLGYLKKMAGKSENCIVLVGFQVEGSRGRELLDGVKELEVDGRKVRIKCRVEKVVFSAHADYNGLLESARRVRARKVFLLHGEEKKMLELEKGIRKHAKSRVFVPKLGESFSI